MSECARACTPVYMCVRKGGGHLQVRMEETGRRRGWRVRVGREVTRGGGHVICCACEGEREIGSRNGAVWGKREQRS